MLIIPPRRSDEFPPEDLMIPLRSDEPPAIFLLFLAESFVYPIARFFVSARYSALLVIRSLLESSSISFCSPVFKMT
jgi:hypothetical protein